MRYNCVSFALKLENRPGLKAIPNLDYHLEPVEAVSKYCKDFGISCRSLESINSPVCEDEWEISFWGFIAVYDPDDYCLFSCQADYHFSRKCEDGIWRERMTWDADIEEIDISEKIAEFEEFGYRPLFFALKIIE